MWQLEIINHLQYLFDTKKKRNPRYSLRSYAKKIGLSSGSLSDILKKKRRLTPQLGRKLLSKLDLEESSKLKILKMIEAEENQTILLVAQEANKLIKKWYYFPVLNLLEITPASTSLDEISKRLNISKKQAQESLRFLVKKKFISLNPNGRGYQVHSNAWKTTDNIADEVIRSAHRKGLDLAKKALDISVDSRDYTSIVFPGNSKQLYKVRTEIRKLLMKISKIMATGSVDTVYKLNVQLFPLLDQDNLKSK